MASTPAPGPAGLANPANLQKSQNPASTWIGGRGFDLFFFFGSGALAVLFGLICLWYPSAILPLWIVWLWMVDGPHLFATWQRTYWDARFRQQQGRLLRTSLLWLLPGPLLLLLSWWLHQPGLFDLYLAYAALWAFYHVTRQHYGVLAIYQRLGQTSAAARQTDKWLLYGVMWLAFVLFLALHPAQREILGLSAQPGVPEQWLLWALQAGMALALLSWLGLLVWRWRAHEAVKPGLFALLVATGVTLFALLVVGLREPLISNPIGPEHAFMASSLVGGVLHGVQYLGMVIITSRRRADGHCADGRCAHGGEVASHPDWSQRLGRAPLMAYGLMLSLSLLYLLLNWLRGVVPIGMDPATPLAQMCLALYWGLFFHHYWLDQKIWKPSRDAGLRKELGMGGV